MTKTMSPEDHLRARIESQRLEIERLRGLKPELPPRAPDGEGLPRYGLRWNGPHEPVTVPMDDGFWTPWHLAAKAPAHEPGVVYRKWPGEPPHCSSCDCGMTDEQKRTVPFEDYQTFHTALMAIVHESKSFTEAVRLASDALQRKTAEPASREACSRAHPHENMNAECQRLAHIAQANQNRCENYPHCDICGPLKDAAIPNAEERRCPDCEENLGTSHWHRCPTVKSREQLVPAAELVATPEGDRGPARKLGVCVHCGERHAAGPCKDAVIP